MSPNPVKWPSMRSLTRTEGDPKDAPIALMIGLAVALGLGLLRLHQPLVDDTSMFATYARMLDGGAVLYEDIWDLKQPGIFYFFLTAGRAFTFSEAGFRFGELLWLMAGGLTGALFLRRHLDHKWLAAMFPMLAVGWFYLVARPNDLGQVETLVGPLFLVFMLLVLPEPGQEVSWWRMVGAGIVLGSIGWFKLLLVLGPVFMAIVVIGDRWRAKSFSIAFTRYAVPLAIGGSIPLVGLVLWSIFNGTLDALWYTYVTFPSEILTDRDPGRLRGVAVRAVRISAPLLALAAPLVLGLGRQKWRHASTRVAAAWLIVIGPLLLAGTWWSYHTNLLFFPLAWLAVVGLAAMAASAQKWARRSIMGGALLLALPALAVSLQTLSDQARLGFGYGDPQEFRVQISDDYRLGDEALQAISLDTDETIAVVGDMSVIVHMSGHDQGTPFHGIWNQRRPTDAARDITERRPDWIFVNGELPTELELTVSEMYSEGPSVEAGQWFHLVR